MSGSSIAISKAKDSRSLIVGVTHPLNKVFQSRPFDFKGHMSNQAKIELALNEYEATQLVLFPESGLTDITITAAPLLHENKTDTIPVDSIQINPIGYAYLKGGNKTHGRTGFHPDILLPNQPLNLEEGIPQPVLITVYTPPGTRPGKYQSTISIKNGNRLNQQVTLSVHVYNFLIPDIPRFKALSLARRHGYAQLWPQELGYPKLNEKQENEVFLKIADIGFRNHLPPTGFLVNGLVSYDSKYTDKHDTYLTYPTHDRVTGNFDPITTDKYIDYMISKGANSFFIGVTSDIYKYKETSKQREEVLLKYLDDLIPYLKKQGILGMSYLYNIDEPWAKDLAHAKKIYRKVKKRYGSDVHFMQNTNQNNGRILGDIKNYFQAVDINLGFFNITELQQYRDKYPGIFHDVWWNVNKWPRTHPNLFLEYPLIDARIIGPMSYKYNIQGFEYWELTYIGKIKNYHPVSYNDFQIEWIIDDNSLDGLLLYPNTEYGFYSSMRLVSFRDGMEDLELLYLLQEKVPDNPILKVKMINDIEDYTGSIKTISNFREELYSALEKLNIKEN